MFHFARPAAIALILATPLHAGGHEEQAAELFEVMRLADILAVMRDEGLEYGESIGNDLLPGGANAEWTGTVDQLYRLDRMIARVEIDFTAALDGADIGPMIEFFATEKGQEIIALEITARTALMDDAVEEASREMAAIAMADETGRYQLIDRFITANDLIESNVVGALNSNYAFFTGLVDGGALGGTLTEDQILADVWAQEPEIRTNTTEWVVSFLLMAYQPLSDEDIEAYIAFSESEAGQDLNRALFAGFDGLFEDISRGLGLAAADQMSAQDL